MSRGKWEQQGKRTYAMGVCLLHRRPVTYAEGLRKGCVSRRRCKWFRGPDEGGEPPPLTPDAACPADEEDEEEYAEEEWYECQACGYVFREPDYTREERGECFGFPAYEEISCCPRCKSGGYARI